MELVMILTTITFILAVIASIPALYFSYKFYPRNKQNALISFFLFLALIFHAIYHLVKTISPEGEILTILEFLSSFMILLFAIDYVLVGREE